MLYIKILLSISSTNLCTELSMLEADYVYWNCVKDDIWPSSDIFNNSSEYEYSFPWWHPEQAIDHYDYRQYAKKMQQISLTVSSPFYVVYIDFLKLFLKS